MKERRLSFLFFLVMFVIGTDTFLVSPLLPTLTQYYGISTSLSGFIVSAYAVGYMISALLIGPISDRHDRKRILVIGLVVFTLATAGCGLANTFAMIRRWCRGGHGRTANLGGYPGIVSKDASCQSNGICHGRSGGCSNRWGTIGELLSGMVMAISVLLRWRHCLDVDDVGRAFHAQS